MSTTSRGDTFRAQSEFGATGIDTWLGTVPEPARVEVRRRLHRRQLSRGEYLMRAGEPADALWIVESGHAAAQTTTPDGLVATLNVMGPGEIIGELGLLGGRSERTVSVVALDRLRAHTLARDDFEALREAVPDVDRFLLQLLIERIVRLSELVNDAYVTDADTRVLRRLLSLAGGVDAEPPVTVPIDQATLASLAGASRQTANRVLRLGVDEGWLELKRRRIEVLDVARLAQRCRGEA